LIHGGGQDEQLEPQNLQAGYKRTRTIEIHPTLRCPMMAFGRDIEISYILGWNTGAHYQRVTLDDALV